MNQNDKFEVRCQPFSNIFDFLDEEKMFFWNGSSKPDREKAQSENYVLEEKQSSLFFDINLPTDLL